MFLTASWLYTPVLKVGTIMTLPCLSVAILPRRVTEVTSAVPEAEGFPPKLFFVYLPLNVLFKLKSMHLYPRWCQRDSMASWVLTYLTGEPGVASGAAGEAAVEEGFGKVILVAMARLALLLKLVIGKIICWTSKTKMTGISFLSWVPTCRSAKINGRSIFPKLCFSSVGRYSVPWVMRLLMENTLYLGKKII